MGIKRGVSLYSYQQEQFFKRLDTKAQIKEVREVLGTDGIEIIDQQTIRDYPNPTDKWVDEWKGWIAEYNMTPVTMDVYMDVLQFRDHVMDHHECAERLKGDIKLAAKLGFQNVRCLSAVPLAVIAEAEPVAAEYNVRIGKEIHSNHVLDDAMVTEIVDYVDRTGSKFVGLVPDMGIFQYTVSMPDANWRMRHGTSPEYIEFEKMVLESKMPMADAVAIAHEKFPQEHKEGFMGGLEFSFEHVLEMILAQKPELMKDLVPYIVSIHGKIWEMTEIPGQPGQYHDASIDYATPIKYLKEGGYEGYINTEYEGQRHQQDRGMDYLANEVEEVRRHHEMLKRLIGE